MVLTTGIVPAGGLTVKLSSNSPAVTVPATFVVPAPSVGSEVLGVVVNQVSKNTTVTIMALSDPAPAGGLTADVTLGDPDALQFFVPPPVTFAPGQESTDFEVDVTNVTAPVHTTISVTVDGVNGADPGDHRARAGFAQPAGDAQHRHDRGHRHRHVPRSRSWPCSAPAPCNRTTST